MQNRRGEVATHTLVSRVATLLGLVVAVVAALGARRTADHPMSAPGFSGDAGKFALAVGSPSPSPVFFMSLVALARRAQHADRFAIPAFTPVLLNLAFIGMALFAVPYLTPGAGAGVGGGSSAACCSSLQVRPLMNRHDAALRPPLRPRRAPS